MFSAFSNPTEYFCVSIKFIKVFSPSMPGISVLRNLRQEDYKSEDSLGYTVKYYLKVTTSQTKLNQAKCEKLLV